MMLRVKAQVLVVLSALLVARLSEARVGSPQADRIRGLIEALSYDQARRELAGGDPNDPALAIERARLALYELDCDRAAAIFDAADLPSADGAQWLAQTARGCQRVIAATVVDRDEDRAIEIHWQDEHDRALAPWVFDTVAMARDALSRDLGVDWPKPTSIVVVSDLLSLSAMTALPYKSAQTTGTVAVAKWGRVTLLSPRASRHGYAWLDTIAHELTHLAVTRATGDRAPLWLQEGVAKREEQRWRDPGPFDGRPSADEIARRGFQAGLAIPLDRLGPSIAMLPSAELARVAFAEVTGFVGFYAKQQRDDALARLLGELRGGKDPDAALAAASGAGLAEWSRRWRARVDAQPRDLAPSDWQFGPRHERDGRSLRDGARVAELLAARGHGVVALERLEAALSKDGLAAIPTRSAPQDPSVLWLHARLLEETNCLAQAELLVADPAAVTVSFGPWWVLRSRLALAAEHGDEASESIEQALAVDPLDAEVACSPGWTHAPGPSAASGRISARAELCRAALGASGPGLDPE